MGILFWYVFRQYLKVFTMCMSGLLTVYLVVDFFEKLRKFLEYDAELSIMLAYLFYKVPEISFKLSPLAALMATILTLGVLNKNNEITAMRSCGVSYYQIAMPFMVFGAVATLILFSFTAVIIPYSNDRADYVKNVLIKKKPERLSLTNDRLWLRLGQNALLRINFVESEGRLLRGLILYRVGQDFKLEEVLEAEAANYKRQGWLLSNVLRRVVSPNGKLRIDEQETLSLELPLTPEDFETWLSLDSENMSLSQLQAHIRRLSRDGHNSDRFLTDYWGRVAFSTVTIIMTIVGMALSLVTSGTRGGTVAKGIGQALGIGFLFWVTHSVGIVLGRNGALMPIVGGWIASLLFFTVGLNMFLKFR